ncbi:sigma 54-interacting transcriptional regulator [bacterium]|nr:sigma 54-interacting transcriptional regulator [bacterium]
MPGKRSLSSEDRKFFILVRKATISNPFSEERLELDIKIANFQRVKERPHDIEDAVESIETRILNLEEGITDIIKHYEGKDRQILETSIQFLFFYRYRKQFDRFIKKQIEAGDTPIKLDFINEIFSFLQPRGFSQEQIQGAIEHSYQFRRAFHFIDQNLIGRSPVMRKLRYDLWNNIFTHNIEMYRKFLLNRMEDFSTLILGETGTGKGTVARAIGRSGYIPFDLAKKSFVESFMRSFVSINLSQFPETLIESELFGHKKGAFTGAIEDYIGVFGRCSLFGAIFLDEIGEIAQPIQIKLLQVLQERVFYPVGSRQQERFQGRVIAATNRSINELRNNNIFRDDFYYRLCSDVIVVPTLQQRIQEDPAELDDLLEFIINKIVGTDSRELTYMVRATIRKQLGDKYPWYGNVRELEQCVRRVILNKKYLGDSRPEQNTLSSNLNAIADSGEVSANRLLSGYCKLLYDRFGTYEEVARRTQLDRRTVTKYIKTWEP